MYDTEKMYSYFDKLSDEKKTIASDTIEEYAYFLNQLDELKKLPLIAVDKKNKALQKITPAGRMIREISQAIDSKRKTLLSLLQKDNVSEVEELLDKFREFE